jgi:large subunit ribosomal protein L18
MEDKYIRLQRRIKSIRKKIFGTQERPRVFVKRSNKHIYVHVANDEVGKVICGMSDISLKNQENKTKTELSYDLGLKFGEFILEKGINKIVFDRKGYKYHGRVKALAEGLRQAGVSF